MNTKSWKIPNNKVFWKAVKLCLFLANLKPVEHNVRFISLSKRDNSTKKHMDVSYKIAETQLNTDFPTGLELPFQGLLRMRRDLNYSLVTAVHKKVVLLCDRKLFLR